MPSVVLFVVSLLLCCALSAPTRAEVTLIAPGQTPATIVLPEQTEFEAVLAQQLADAEKALREKNPQLDATKFEAAKVKALKNVKGPASGDEEALAAEELQTILEKISGVKLPIVRGLAAGGAGPKILLGAALAKGAGLGAKIEKLDKDGLLCQVQEQNLILAGKRARGTLYAAYEFLETLGCRWVMPGPFGELYPSLKSVATAIDTVENPSHGQRYWWCTLGQGKDYPRWTLRNKGNFVKAHGDQNIAQGHALTAPLAWAAKNPKYGRQEKRPVPKKRPGPAGTVITEMVEQDVWVLPDEHYAMAGGKVSHSVPNFSNPATWDLFAEYYIDYFTRNPNVDYVSISAADGLVIDERPESIRLRSNDYDFAMGAFCATDQLWFFHNRVIERVAKVFPTKKFGVLVYSNNMMPPRIEHVNPQMALVFAPLGISPLTAVGDPKERTNLVYKEWLEDWMAQARAVGAETYYYDYEPMGFCWNMAMICPRWGIIGKNYPYFHKLGLTGHTTQGHDDWGASGLNNYLMQRLYWDVTTPYKEIIADYCQARFGAAAPAMQAYYDRLEKALDDAPDLYSNEMWANHLVLTPQVRKEARALLEQALQSADTERAKAQIATMVHLQAMTDAMCDAIELADETGDFAAGAKLMDVAFTHKDKLNELYSHFVNPQRMNTNSNAQFETGGQYKQYVNFAKKINEAAAKVVLPRQWKGMLDTGQRAWAAGYHKPEVSVSQLEDQDVTVCPDVKYKTQRQVAAFFYRTEADVPADFAGKKTSLYFASIIAKGLQVWINGQPVEFEYPAYKDTTRRGPNYFWYDYNHELEVDITPYLKAGQRNTIAFRTFKSFDFGGTYRRIFLLAR